MIVVGVTGTLGAGKSSVGRLFERWGAFRLDADALAREAVAPGSEGLAEVREAFGPGIVGPDGAVDRAELRRLAFADPAARERLERIVHPAVIRLLRERLVTAERAGVRIAVAEVPLLYEAGLADLCDVVVAVDAPADLRRRRVAEERGLPAEEFDRIEAAQWPPERKRERADVVIRNDGSPEELEARAREAWRVIESRLEPGFAAPEGAPAAAGQGAPAVDAEAAAGPSAAWSVDLHMHTFRSHDCLSPPADVVRRAREVGLDRIAITDHDEIRGAFEARAVDPELVIVGEEVRTAEGLDLIGLFLERHIRPGASFRETAREIRAQGGVVYLPHPFDRRRGTTEAFLDGVTECVDAVEGFNARIHDAGRNERAAAWARARGLPLGAGSDAHLLAEIGRGRARVPPFRGPRDFLEALRRGWIEGETSGPWVHLGSTWAKIRRRLFPAAPGPDRGSRGGGG